VESPIGNPPAMLMALEASSSPLGMTVELTPYEPSSRNCRYAGGGKIAASRCTSSL